MAIRSRAVYPDQVYTLANGDEIAVVSEDALLDEVVAHVRGAYRFGGIVQVVQDRAKTGVPNEMVTVGALIQWQDRTDAKPQPEPAVEPQTVPGDLIPSGHEWTPMPESLPEDRWRSDAEDPTPDELEAQLEAEAREEHEDVPIPQEAVVIGAPVGMRSSAPQDYAPPTVTETPITHGQPPQRPPRQEGVGSGALPFQRGGEPGVPPEGVNLDDIAHGDASSLPRGEAVPAPAGSSEGLSDGLVVTEDEDESDIPEQYR